MLFFSYVVLTHLNSCSAAFYNAARNQLTIDMSVSAAKDPEQVAGAISKVCTILGTEAWQFLDV